MEAFFELLCECSSSHDVVIALDAAATDAILSWKGPTKINEATKNVGCKIAAVAPSFVLLAGTTVVDPSLVLLAGTTAVAPSFAIRVEVTVAILVS